MVAGNGTAPVGVEEAAHNKAAEGNQTMIAANAGISRAESSETTAVDESLSTDGSAAEASTPVIKFACEGKAASKKRGIGSVEGSTEGGADEDADGGSVGSAEAGDNEAGGDDQVSSMEHKVAVIQRLYSEGISIRKFAQKYKLSRTTLVKWKSKYDRWMATGVNTFHSDGRPSVLDEIGEANIIQVATAAAAANRHLMRRELQSVIESEIADSKRRRGMENDREGVSGETVRRIIKRLKTTFGETIFSSGTGQHVADARDVFAGYCMLMACVRDMLYDRICNISSATFGIERKTEGLRVFMRASKPRSAGGVEVPNVCVRLFYGSCGDGMPSMDPVYLLPDAGLGEGEFEWTSLLAGHARGFVCFTNNGRPNGRFQYWLMNQAIRWCQALLIGKFPNHLGDGGSMRVANRVFLIVDDHQTLDTGPVAAAVMDSRVVAEYYVGFVPHAYSLNPFLTLLKRRILYSHNSYQSNSLSGIDSSLATEVKRILDTRTGYSDLDRVCYSEALRQLSFGVDYCQDTSCGGISWAPNFRSTMAQAGRFYRDSEIASMESKIIEMVDLFRVQGYLTDGQLMDAGVMRNASAAPATGADGSLPATLESSSGSSSSSSASSASHSGSSAFPPGASPSMFQASSSAATGFPGLFAPHGGQSSSASMHMHHPFSGQVLMPNVEQRGRVYIIYPLPGMAAAIAPPPPQVPNVAPVSSMAPPPAMNMSMNLGMGMMYPGIPMSPLHPHGAMAMPSGMQPQQMQPQQMQMHHMQQMRQQMHQQQQHHQQQHQHQHQQHHQQAAMNPLAGMGDVFSYPHLSHGLPPHLSGV